jgi:two-component system, sensor histidine kinase FlrB
LAERLQHMERQVTDMLAFARVGRLTLEQTDLVSLIERSVEAFEPNLAGRQVQVRVEKRVDFQEILGNGDALQGIILNLLNNAMEAMGDGAGTVRILVERCLPGWARITVSDDGPGIPAESLARVFEPFYTTRSAGTGLGLAIVDCVVRAHGGRVRCRSAAGPGGSFLLELPIASDRSLLPSGFSGTEQQLRPSNHGTA